LLAGLGGEEFLAVPEALGRGGHAHPREQRLLAAQQPRLQQVGHDGHILPGLAHALRDAAHAVPDLQTDVPEGGEQPLQTRRQLGLGARLDEHQQVDVGGRLQLLASVAAHRDQRGLVADGAEMLGPDVAQDGVDKLAVLAHQLGHRHTQIEALKERLAALLEPLAVGLDARALLGARILVGGGMGVQGGGLVADVGRVAGLRRRRSRAPRRAG